MCMKAAAPPGTEGNGRWGNDLHGGTDVSGLSGLANLFLSAFQCSHRSNDFSFKECDQVMVEFLPLYDEWLNISAQLTWATAAWYHAISNLLVLGYKPGSAAEGKLSGSQWEILAMKFQARDLHGCECWQVSSMLFFNVLEVILYLHRDQQGEKHSLSVIDLNIFLSNKYRKPVLFLSPMRGEKCFQHNIKLKNIHCKCEIIKQGKIHFSMKNAPVKW